MTGELKIKARQAMLNSKNKGAVLLLLEFAAVLFSLLPLFFKIPFVLKFLLPFFAFSLLSVARLYVQVKFILYASNKNGKVKINAKYALKACVLRLVIVFLKLKDFALYELIPFVSAVVITALSFDSEISQKAFFAACSGILLLALIGLWFSVLAFQRYSKAMFLLAAYPLLTVKEILKITCKENEKDDRRLATFKLTFIPWFLACVFIFPIPFVALYYKQSITCYFIGR